MNLGAQDLSDFPEDYCSECESSHWNGSGLSDSYDALYKAFGKCMLEDDKVYAITVTPDPKWYRSTDPELQLDQLWNTFLRLNDKVFEYYVFTCGLTENGNMHIHGAFTVKDKKKYYRVWLPRAKRTGIPKYAVKVKRDVDSDWFTYLQQNARQCFEVITEHPVIWSHYTDYVYVRQLKTYTRCQRLSKRKKVEKPKYTYFDFAPGSDSDILD